MESKVIITGLILALAGILIGSGIYYFIISPPVNYSYETEISGVSVYHNIPLENLQNFRRIALFKNDDPAAITCNFEISALSIPDRKGYRVDIKQGNKGLYIKEKSAEIRGFNEEEILQACHVFSCILSGIKCPENFQEFRGKIPSHENRINLVLDTSLGPNGIRAYTEILGALGFIQAGIVDRNKDKKFSDIEKIGNEVSIYPYMKNDSECLLQPFKNFVQETSGATENGSINCDELSSGIFILKAENDEGEIIIQENKILILGNRDSVPKSAIILRDILSPEWIRAVYGLS